MRSNLETVRRLKKKKGSDFINAVHLRTSNYTRDWYYFSIEQLRSNSRQLGTMNDKALHDPRH